jgi:lysophospholipase L1-like esterase
MPRRLIGELAERARNSWGLYVVAAIAAFLLVEAGYRINLLIKDSRLQLRSETIAELPLLGVYSRSLWQFDLNEGFQYSNRRIFQTHIRRGQIDNCVVLPPLNKYGSPGVAEGNYEDSDVKLAAFGDSFSVFTDANNMTWLNYLQRALQDQLGRSVHILNFARDGIGLVQMFDIAAIRVPIHKPDIALIAVASPNMVRPRIWRIEKIINGELRVLTTFEPTENPDLNSSYETYILHPEAENDWCEAHKKGGPLDRIGSEMIDKYLRFRPPRYSVFTPYRSFLFNKIIHGNPFYSNSDRSFGSGITPRDLGEDKKLLTSIETLNRSGIPYIVIHLPFYPEVSAGEEYMSPIMAEIGREISRLTGRPMHGLLDYITLPIGNPERMNSSKDNMHPSTWGMQMYAKAVTKIVVTGEVNSNRPPTAGKH